MPLPFAWLLARLPLVLLALALGSQTDTTYLHYGQLMAAGAWPYRDFAVEYPPLAMGFLALPALAAHAVSRLSADSYTVCFGAQVLILDALFTIGLARWAGRRAVVLYLLLSLIGGSVLQTFDLLPSVLAATAVIVRQRGHDRWAWLALAAAAASKGWPLLLCPLFIVLDMGNPRRLLANMGLFVLLFAALIAPGLLGGIVRAEQGLAFHAQRQPEVETVYANLAMIAHDAFGVAARVYVGGSAAVPDAHSSNVASLLPGWAELPHLVLFGLLGIGFVRTLPRVRHDQAALASSAALLVGLFILGFSVLQTQYLLWLTPLAALVLAKTTPAVQLRHVTTGVWVRVGGAASLLLFALLSHLLRFKWDALLAMQPGAVTIATVRNGFFILALVFLWQCVPSAMQSREHLEYRKIA